MTEKLSGKVAQILSDREVVLNRGSNHGLEEGAYIGIIDPNTEAVTDPETNEEIPGLRSYKIALRVSKVSKRLAIASTYKTITENVGGSYTPIAQTWSKFLTPPKHVTTFEKLPYDQSFVDADSSDEKYVRVGDDFEIVSRETADSGVDLAEEE